MVCSGLGSKNTNDYMQTVSCFLFFFFYKTKMKQRKSLPEALQFKPMTNSENKSEDILGNGRSFRPIVDVFLASKK